MMRMVNRDEGRWDPSRSWTRRSVGLAAAAIVMWSSSAAIADATATLTLDGLSFISFQDQEVLALPTGSTLEFQLGDANADGSIPFTIDPGGLSIAPVDLPGGGGSLRYGLASAASGTITPAAGGHIIQFNANVTASMTGSDGHTGTYTYAMPFTTETAAASDILGQVSVERTGVRLVDGVWYAQIVAATTNRENAVPAPGTAVYSVLSGQFDHLPIGQ